MHILDHAHFVSGDIPEMNMKLIHFNTSICASYFIRNGVTAQKEIDTIMVKILNVIVEKELTVKEKNGTYTKKNGKKVQKYRTRIIKFDKMLTAYHNRHFNSSKSVMPHFHFLFNGATRAGKDFMYLKQALEEEAKKYQIKFNFMEEKQVTSLSKKQLSRIENMSWLLNQGNISKMKNYLLDSSKLKDTLNILKIHYENTQNISYFIKILSILNQRLQELNIDFNYDNTNLKESIFFFLNNRQKAMINDLKNHKFVELDLNNVLDRELLKHSHGFSSDVIDIIRKKFVIKKIPKEQLLWENTTRKVNTLSQSKVKFRDLIISDIKNTLIYAKNEKDWKEILLKIGYTKVSIKSKKMSNGKRHKIGLNMTTKKGTKLFISFNNMELEYSDIIYIMMLNHKKNKLNDCHESNLDRYEVKTIPGGALLSKYEYKIKILLQIYPTTKNKKVIKEKAKYLAKKYNLDKSDMYDITTFKNNTTIIVDDINKITLKKTLVKDIKSSISDMLDIAEMKGWDINALIIMGDKNFKEEAQLQINNRSENLNERIIFEGGLKL
jgi:hypothetical protein